MALKVIAAKRAKAESYHRFVRGITYFREHPEGLAVLPVFAHLPDVRSREDPPWLAMPIATPIAEALKGCNENGLPLRSPISRLTR